MMYASDFREKARKDLKGNWAKAVAVGLVATLLTGGIAVTNTGAGGDTSGYLGFANHEMTIWMTTAMIGIGLIAMILGGAVNLGWCQFHIHLVKNEESRFGDLFSHIDRIGRGFAMTFVTALFVMLWSLLFVIPGIIAAYSYAMVPYLMAEFPELKLMDAIRESKRLMKGNKWRLFCLQMSFFGWALLCLLSLGIGNLWLTPYMRAAEAAFYMHVTGRLGKKPEEKPEEKTRENPVEF